MRDIQEKTDGVSTLSAGAFNANLRSELQSLVSGAGFTLDNEAGPDNDLLMLSKTIAAYANSGSFYSDSGAANAYSLVNSAGLQNISSYIDGLVITFKPGNSNTGASTVNVNSLGVKSITYSDGSALKGGEIRSGHFTTLIYNNSNNRFEIFLDPIGDVFVDSGAANAYVLTKISSFKNNSPSYYDGMKVTFKPTNANTGASTVNVNGLGVKSITHTNGTALGGGEFTTIKYATLLYNLSNDRFEIAAYDDVRLNYLNEDWSGHTEGQDIRKSNGNFVKNQCTAWVNFGWTGSAITIRDSYNIASVTRNGVGIYELAFEAAMDNTNYSFTFFGSVTNGRASLNKVDTTSILTTGFEVRAHEWDGASTNPIVLTDSLYFFVQVFGGKN